jgi:hypothetical protein
MLAEKDAVTPCHSMNLLSLNEFAVVIVQPREQDKIAIQVQIKTEG